MEWMNYRKLDKLKLHLRRRAALETFNARVERLALLRHFERERRLLLQQASGNKRRGLVVEPVLAQHTIEGIEQRGVCGGSCI